MLNLILSSPLSLTLSNTHIHITHTVHTPNFVTDMPSHAQNTKEAFLIPGQKQQNAITWDKSADI